MYTNLCVHETIKIITNELQKLNVSTEFFTQINVTLKLLLKQNHFKFKNKIQSTF